MLTGIPPEPPTRVHNRRQAAAAPISGAKRSVPEAEAELDEEAEPAAEAATLGGELASLPPRRSSGREAAGGRLQMLLAIEQGRYDVTEGTATRSLPLRATAIGSPAGKRRRLTGLDWLADTAAAEAGTAMEGAAEAAGQPSRQQRSGPGALATSAAAMTAVVVGDEEEAEVAEAAAAAGSSMEPLIAGDGFGGCLIPAAFWAAEIAC